jgi:hypothetical protein
VIIDSRNDGKTAVLLLANPRGIMPPAVVRQIAVYDDLSRRSRDVNAGNWRRRLACRRDARPQSGDEHPTRQKPSSGAARNVYGGRHSPA